MYITVYIYIYICIYNAYIYIYITVYIYMHNVCSPDDPIYASNQITYRSWNLSIDRWPSHLWFAILTIVVSVLSMI